MDQRSISKENLLWKKQLIKRIPPHSIEAEQSVIGAMLLDRDAILIASEILTSDDFYQNQYGIIFEQW